MGLSSVIFHLHNQHWVLVNPTVGRKKMSPDISHISTKAKAAGVRLNPRVAEDDIAEFEQGRGASLPAEYRTFLLEVGNGGLGPPSYGICRLGELPPDYDMPVPDLRKKFPFTQAWVWEEGEKSPEGTKEDLFCGTIVLGTDGCGQYWILIANGPERGRIWMLSDVGVTPLSPSMTFFEWYHAWLDGRRDWWT